MGERGNEKEELEIAGTHLNTANVSKSLNGSKCYNGKILAKRQCRPWNMKLSFRTCTNFEYLDIAHINAKCFVLMVNRCGSLWNGLVDAARFLSIAVFRQFFQVFFLLWCVWFLFLFWVAKSVLCSQKWDAKLFYFGFSHNRDGRTLTRTQTTHPNTKNKYEKNATFFFCDPYLGQ